jgi:uncharacterized protein Veg
MNCCLEKGRQISRKVDAKHHAKVNWKEDGGRKRRETRRVGDLLDIGTCLNKQE